VSFVIELIIFYREERDRLRIQKQDPLNHMSKHIDDLKRKRDEENKSSSTPAKKSNSSVFTSSSSSRIEQLRAQRYILFSLFSILHIFQSV
jgi:hypothetical protein